MIDPKILDFSTVSTDQTRFSGYNKRWMWWVIPTLLSTYGVAGVVLSLGQTVVIPAYMYLFLALPSKSSLFHGKDQRDSAYVRVSSWIGSTLEAPPRSLNLPVVSEKGNGIVRREMERVGDTTLLKLYGVGGTVIAASTVGYNIFMPGFLFVLAALPPVGYVPFIKLYKHANPKIPLMQ